MDKILFSFNSMFGGSHITMLSIINWGKKVGNFIEYENKEGLQRKNESQLNDMNITLCTIKDLDIAGGLHHWYAKNYSQVGKPVVIDDTIQTGEIYRGNMWHLGLMIQPTDTELKVKIIFD